MSKMPFSANLTDWTYDRLLRWRAAETPDRAFLSFQGDAYETYGDRAALELLLRYNRDDVIYLPRLRAYLRKLPEEELHPAIAVWDGAP